MSQLIRTPVSYQPPLVVQPSAIYYGAQVIADQNINANAIFSAEDFGNNVVTSTYTVTAHGIPSSEVSGTSTLAPGISANSVTSSEIFGAPTITTTYTVIANGIPSSEISGNSNTATVSNVFANGITNSEQLGASAVSATYTIQANGIPSSEVSGASSLSLTVNPQGITTTQQFGAPTVTVVVAVNAASISSNENFGSPAVTATYTINAQGITTAASVGNANTAGAITLQAQGIGPSEQFGASTVTPGAATISANGIPSSQNIGSLTVTVTLLITPHGITTNEWIGGAAASLEAPQQISANSIKSDEQFGYSQISLGALGFTINAGSIPSSEHTGYPHTGEEVTAVIIWQENWPILIWRESSSVPAIIPDPAQIIYLPEDVDATTILKDELVISKP